MASIQHEPIVQDKNTQIPQHLQGVKLQQLEEGADQEVAKEVATPQPNMSISFKIKDRQKKHQRLSNSIKELIEEMNKASKVNFQSPSNLKSKTGKRITMKQLEKLC